MTTCILLISSVWHGEMATPLPSLGKETEVLSKEGRGRERYGHLRSYYYSLRGWGDGRLHFVYSFSKDGEMATPLPNSRKENKREGWFTSILLMFP